MQLQTHGERYPMAEQTINTGKLKENTVKNETLSTKSEKTLLGFGYQNTELVFGIASAVGADSSHFIEQLKERLTHHRYDVEVISVSRDVINSYFENDIADINSEVERINHFMDLGNEIRKMAKDNSILALGVSSEIYKRREKVEQGQPKANERKAFIVNSLKHPAEVNRLREVYMDGFYLIGISEDETRRIKKLTRDGKSDETQAKELIKRDQDEIDGHGQHTRDTFQLSDFFINIDSNIDKIRSDTYRIIELIFGNPHLTPTFDEFAMFSAFTSALRSGDLSRQVGAVVAKDNEIIASGANDCPKAKGGLYWPVINNDHEIIDLPKGRDHTRGYDSNKQELQKIIENILDNFSDSVEKESVRIALEKSKLKDITEYGRIVHAEMEALMFCARNNISARYATLYCTTFPCHNCAKHIIASGITKVIYIEPYPKSKAFDFYEDSITENPSESEKVIFQPFVGVGPRRFFDLFSMNLSSGHPIKRKEKDGTKAQYNPEQSKARIQMLPYSYLEREEVASHSFKTFINTLPEA